MAASFYSRNTSHPKLLATGDRATRAGARAGRTVVAYEHARHCAETLDIAFRAGVAFDIAAALRTNDMATRIV